MFYIGMMTNNKRKNAKGYKYIGKGYKSIEECRIQLDKLKIENPTIPYFTSEGKI